MQYRHDVESLGYHNIVRSTPYGVAASRYGKVNSIDPVVEYLGQTILARIAKSRFIGGGKLECIMGTSIYVMQAQGQDKGFILRFAICEEHRTEPGGWSSPMQLRVGGGAVWLGYEVRFSSVLDENWAESACKSPASFSPSREIRAALSVVYLRYSRWEGTNEA